MIESVLVHEPICHKKKSELSNALIMKSNQLLEPIKLNEALQLEGIKHNQQTSN